MPRASPGSAAPGSEREQAGAVLGHEDRRAGVPTAAATLGFNESLGRAELGEAVRSQLQFITAKGCRL